MTSAPRSERNIMAKGPAPSWVAARIRSPSSGDTPAVTAASPTKEHRDRASDLPPAPSRRQSGPVRSRVLGGVHRSDRRVPQRDTVRPYAARYHTGLGKIGRAHV